MDAFEVVDRFVRNRWHVALEEVLCDGCLSGAVPVALEEDVVVIGRCTHVETHDDGGQSLTFDGTFMLMGVRYPFMCHVFVDPSGQRFLSHIAEFEAVAWATRVAM